MFGVVCGPYIDYRIIKPKSKKAKAHEVNGIDTRKTKGEKAKSRKEHRQKYRI